MYQSFLPWVFFELFKFAGARLDFFHLLKKLLNSSKVVNAILHSHQQFIRVLHTYFFFCCVTWSACSLSRDQTHTSCIECRTLTTVAPDKVHSCSYFDDQLFICFIEFCAALKLLELCLTLDCSPLGSSVHGVFQARILEWAAMTLAGDRPNPGIKPISLKSALARRFFTASATWEGCWVLRGLHIVKIVSSSDAFLFLKNMFIMLKFHTVPFFKQNIFFP